MPFTTYGVHTVDSYGAPFALYVQVVSADFEPDLRPSLSTKMSSSYRRYKKSREEALRKVHELLDKGYRRTRPQYVKDVAKRAVDYHSLRTLEVLLDEFGADHDASELINFLCTPVGSREEKRLGEEDSIRIREMAVYGRKYPNVSAYMIGLIMDNLRVSHPMFAYEDLTELGDDEAESFVFALDFSVAVHEYFMESVNSKLHLRAGTWHQEARKAAPRFSTEFIDFLLTHHDRVEDITKYLLVSNSEVLNIDVAELKKRLDSPANLTTVAIDAGLFLRGVVRYGKQLVGG